MFTWNNVVFTVVQEFWLHMQCMNSDPLILKFTSNVFVKTWKRHIELVDLLRKAEEGLGVTFNRFLCFSTTDRELLYQRWMKQMI